MKKISWLATLPCILGTLSVGATAQESGFNILDELSFKGQIRPRYETVNVTDTAPKAAHAYTARITLGVGAKLLELDGLSSYVELSSVNNFGANRYNSTANGETEYEIVVDPQQARVSQAYIDYKLNKTLLRAGRQDINLDNQRFIGTVDWRQMKQTFDAITLSDSTIENLAVTAGFVYGYQGVKDLPTTDTKSAVFNVKYKVADELSITLYDYMLASMSDTYGAALSGTITQGAKINYRLEYAMQQDATLTYQGVEGVADASYYNIDADVTYEGFTLGANYESLGKKEGDATNGFYTPLATLHKFNGWADVFLTKTNAQGLDDANIHLGYAQKGLGKLMAIYHDFSAQTGANTDLGSELDLLYANAIPGVNGLSGLIKGALYKGGDVTGFTTDKSVAWVQLDYKF